MYSRPNCYFWKGQDCHTQLKWVSEPIRCLAFPHLHLSSNQDHDCNIRGGLTKHTFLVSPLYVICVPQIAYSSQNFYLPLHWYLMFLTKQQKKPCIYCVSEYHFEEIHLVSSAPLFLKPCSSLNWCHHSCANTPRATLHTSQKEFRSLHRGYDPHKHNRISQLNAITTHSEMQTLSINIIQTCAGGQEETTCPWIWISATYHTNTKYMMTIYGPNSEAAHIFFVFVFCWNFSFCEKQI